MTNIYIEDESVDGRQDTKTLGFMLEIGRYGLIIGGFKRKDTDE